MTPELDAAVEKLRAGGVVAFPTETVYGLGADAFCEECVRRVYELKSRPEANPLIVHVADEEMAASAAHWTEEAGALACAFWPGPLTIVLPKQDVVPAIVTAGRSTVAVRAPDHELAIALLEHFGGPLVGPSANVSGHISPTTAEHVRAEFSGKDVFVLDGGPCRTGIESTVVALNTAPAVVLRPGVISAGRIEDMIGRRVDVLRAGSPGDGESMPGPGMMARHYAPRTQTVLFDARDWPSVRRRASGRIVAIALSELVAGDNAHVIAMPREARAYARALYDALRRADAGPPGLIAIERPPARAADPDEAALWEAIRDRLRRAAGEGAAPPT